MPGIPTIDRADPLSAGGRIRSRLAGEPKYFGLDSLGTQRRTFGNLGAGATTLFSCPAGRRALSGFGVVMLHNPSGGAITADLHHVPSGGSAGSTNKMAATVTVAAAATVLYFAKTVQAVLQGGDALVINTGGAGLNAWLTMLQERSKYCAFDGGFIGNLGNTDTVIYTTAGQRSFVLRSLIAYNPSGGALTLTFNVRESGVAVATTNQLVSQSIGTVTGFTLDGALLANLLQAGILSGKGSGAGLNIWANGVLF